MITAEMLQKAAAISCEAHILTLMEHDFSGYTVSQQMERKILRLARKADHPYFYRALRQAASFLLAALVGLSAWLTVDTEAREALFNWLREMGQNSIIYRPTGNSSAVRTQYELPVIPEGYSLYLSEDGDFGGWLLYINDAGQQLQFQYLFSSSGSALLVSRQNAKLTHTAVNGDPADLLISTDPKTASAIIWTTEDGTAFYISAFLDEDDLIALAEGVKQKK